MANKKNKRVTTTYVINLEPGEASGTQPQKETQLESEQFKILLTPHRDISHTPESIPSSRAAISELELRIEEETEGVHMAQRNIESRTTKGKEK